MQLCSDWYEALISPKKELNRTLFIYVYVYSQVLTLKYIVWSIFSDFINGLRRDMLRQIGGTQFLNNLQKADGVSRMYILTA